MSNFRELEVPRRLTDEERGRAETCIRMAFKVGNRYANCYPDVGDDLISDAFVCLLRAAILYDPANAARAKFTTYVHWSLHRFLRLRVRHHRLRRGYATTASTCRRHGAAFDVLALEPDGHADGGGDDRDPADLRVQTLALLMQLRPEQRQALTLRYLDGLTGGETAAAMHLSPRTVNNLLRAGEHRCRALAAREPNCN